MTEAWASELRRRRGPGAPWSGRPHPARAPPKEDMLAELVRAAAVVRGGARVGTIAEQVVALARRRR